MKDWTREEIRKAVREALAEVFGDNGQRPPSSSGGPRAMIVYHAGTAKLDEAESQVREIGRMAGKSGVYMTPPARESACAPGAADRPRTQCRLDTVSRDGLEKVLDRADVLVLPTFCLAVAAKVARLDFHDEDAGFVLSALVRGKKVLAADDGFLVLGRLRNEGLRVEFDRVLVKLRSFGMVLCPTAGLAAEFSRMMTGPASPPVPALTVKPDDATAYDLVTANAIRLAVNEKRTKILVAPGGKVTPLARDLAKDYGVKIVNRRG